MKKLVLAILLIASPAWAQTQLVPKSKTARADPCAPIGRTADGKLIYSMNCNNLPAGRSRAAAGTGGTARRTLRYVIRPARNGTAIGARRSVTDALMDSNSEHRHCER
jgi:hypothetical protein